MGRGREVSETTHCGDVQDSKGISDHYEKEQEDQKRLICTLISTVKHLFGPFHRLFIGVVGDTEK